MELFLIIFIATLGLIIGSFLANYTYRAPRGISVAQGRSRCPKCKNEIAWYDNIPLISYLLLLGKCRKCKKKISPRYPIIEAFTGLVFLVTYLKFDVISRGLPLPYYLLIFCILICILVIDIEHMIIPDELVFWGLAVGILVMLSYGSMYSNILSGFIASILLMSLYAITKGKGMGLGDVKLALWLGSLVGISGLLSWFFVSFLIGGIFGLFLILVRAKKLKDKVAFAPFLIFGFWIIILYPYGINLWF